MPVVVSEGELQRFRDYWTGQRLLDAVEPGGPAVGIDWPVGVGKSTACDAVTREALDSGRYPLAIVLAPTHLVLNERELVKTPSPAISTTVLRPRPQSLCGPSRDREWRTLETTGCATLGRRVLCGSCPHRAVCFWPGQYTRERLESVQVIFGTHAQLLRASDFVEQMRQSTGAERVLLVLDEDHAAMTNYRRVLDRGDLDRFADVLRRRAELSDDSLSRAWLEAVERLADASTRDLRGPGWYTPPAYPNWLAELQQAGRDRYGNAFRCLVHDLKALTVSPLPSRERTSGGNLRYALVPGVGCDLVIFTATGNARLLEFRFGRPVRFPFADYRFVHPDTHWYNLGLRLGALRHFRRNAKQILDFFADLTARRLRDGKRVVLVSRKRFEDECAAGMERRLHDSGLSQVRVLTAERMELLDILGPFDVPLIHYGISGINRFTEYDSAFCLNSFLVGESVLDEVLQDLVASDGYIPLEIRTQVEGLRRRRTAGVRHHEHRYYDLDGLAGDALQAVEFGAVLQAVGRVRPFTKPREVITFQYDPLPDVEYDREFLTLAEARAHFGVVHRRAQAREKTAAAVRAARSQGLTQKQAATRCGVSLRTVQRYWRDPKPATKPNKCI